MLRGGSGIDGVAMYSSGSNPLVDARLPPPRGRGENCALRVIMRDPAVLLLLPPGRAARDAETADDDRERTGGKGGREFVGSILFLPLFF